jgi:hypothetical protein
MFRSEYLQLYPEVRITRCFHKLKNLLVDRLSSFTNYRSSLFQLISHSVTTVSPTDLLYSLIIIVIMYCLLVATFKNFKRQVFERHFNLEMYPSEGYSCSTRMSSI